MSDSLIRVRFLPREFDVVESEEYPEWYEVMGVFLPVEWFEEVPVGPEIYRPGEIVREKGTSLTYTLSDAGWTNNAAGVFMPWETLPGGRDYFTSDNYEKVEL